MAEFNHSMKLSIITPTLNCVSTFRATLESVRLLVAAGAEHIVVDSGSNDGTFELATASGAQVIYYPKGNMYAAINAGMKLAHGDWMTYINGDDLLYSDAITDIVQNVNNDVDIVYGNIDYIDEAGRFLFSWRSPSPRRLIPLMPIYSAVPQQGTIFRRRVYEKLGGFDTHYHFTADYDFWVRAMGNDLSFHKYNTMSIAAFRLLRTQLSQMRKSEMAPEGQHIRTRQVEGRSQVELAAQKAWATLYRISTNLDSYVLRTLRGRGLDRRNYNG
jgi:glycosyltransferase involved in cell wall biosynthesis